MAVFFARMVIPRSRSNSLESITRSTWASLARKVPLWFSMASTSVVLPWSTCAMMAILRRLLLKTTVLPVGGTACIQANGGLRCVASVYNNARQSSSPRMGRTIAFHLRLPYLVHNLWGPDAHLRVDGAGAVTLILFCCLFGARWQFAIRVLLDPFNFTC